MSSRIRNQRILIVCSATAVLVLAPCYAQNKAKTKTQQKAVIELPFPMGGNAEGPETAAQKKDLSMYAPGGSRFIYLEDKNLEPRESAEAAAMRIPGPGEPGFVWVEQENLYPGESNQKKKPPAREKTKK